MLKLKTNYLLLIFIGETGVFHTQRPDLLSICLLGRKILATIFIMKINQVLGPFSTTVEKIISS